MHQAICDCGKNPDNKWFVYSDAPKDGRCRTFIVCPGCGEGPYEGWAEIWREASGADPVAGPEGGLQAGLHEEVHAGLAAAEAGFDRVAYQKAYMKTYMPVWRARRKVGRPAKHSGKPWEAEGISRALWYRRRKVKSG